VSVVTVGAGRQVSIEYVAPGAYTSTASLAAISGTEIDASSWRSVSYTVVCATNAIKWAVYGANASDYSDEVAVLSAATVSAGASSSYSVAQAPFRYYRVKGQDDSGGVHGSITIRGVAKG
jgi:hypothetical protein